MPSHNLPQPEGRISTFCGGVRDAATKHVLVCYNLRSGDMAMDTATQLLKDDSYIYPTKGNVCSCP